MTDKQIIDRVNVKECKYYCNGKCERYEEFVEADYANYSVKCICEKENDLGTYDICDYQQLKRKEQECEELKEEREKAKNYNLEYGQLLIKATNKNNKLKQTLTEIKEIAEDFYLDGEYVKVKYLAQDILQKISEVLEQ